jgi:hypothetical protein
MSNRTEKLPIPLTPHERAAIEWLAKKQGLSMSALVRLKPVPDIVAEYEREHPEAA